jgi:hypothetical protein
MLLCHRYNLCENPFNHVIMPLPERLFNNLRRVSYNGSTSASQADSVGSIPIIRSTLMRYLLLLFKGLVTLLLGVCLFILVSIVAIRLTSHPNDWIAPLKTSLEKHVSNLTITIHSLTWMPDSFYGLEATKLAIHYHDKIITIEKIQCSPSLAQMIIKQCFAFNSIRIDNPSLSWSTKKPYRYPPSSLETAFSHPKHADTDNSALPSIFIKKWSVHNGRIVTNKQLSLHKIDAQGSLTPHQLQGTVRVQDIHFHAFSLDNSVGHFQYQPCHKDPFHIRGESSFHGKTIAIDSHRPYHSLEDMIAHIVPTLEAKDTKKHLSKELLHRVFKSL